MNLNESDYAGPDGVETPARIVWTKPSVTRLRAGAAENVSGSTIMDSPLERLGS